MPRGVSLGSALATCLLLGSCGGDTPLAPGDWQEPTPPTFVHLTGGWDHVCAVDTQGSAFCWGEGDDGQLGGGPPGDPGRVGPVKGLVSVSGAVRFASVAAGGTHTCGVSVDGELLCWGAGSEGQLGTGRSGNVRPLTPYRETSPVPSLANGSFESVTAGARHTCALAVGGEAFCWGRNDSGQLGDGTVHHRVEPVRAALGLRFSVLSAGREHTCGVTTEGAAYCWGRGLEGQLGSGSTSPVRPSPVAVAGGHHFVSISAGERYTCGVAAEGHGYCWGEGDVGQLGTGGFEPRSRPAAIEGGLRFSRLSAGIFHTCWVTVDGSLHCWGRGYLGELGTGFVEVVPSPRPVVGSLAFEEATSGRYHTCARTREGGVHCWGLGATRPRSVADWLAEDPFGG